MEYEVLARRWRPRCFGDVVGQEQVIRTIANAIGAGRVAHAYLFVGPRGTGKTSMARLLAMALNCGDGPRADFSPSDPVCEAIWRGEHLDVTEIDGASHNSVDEVRELRERCAYAPASARYRIFILDEVHMLTHAAFNALLKILEEPPAHVKFILATTEVGKVPMTIISRCQRFQFHPLGAEDMVKKLSQIVRAEKMGAEQTALEAVARLAMGGMRDAESILDQLLAYADGQLGERDVLEMYGLASGAEVETMTGLLKRRDAAGALALAEDWYGRGLDLQRALVDLRESLHRDLLAAGDGARRRELLELLRTLHSYEASLPFSLSEKTTFALALLEAMENSRRRPIESILAEVGR
jgi:DNA polymerase-3 subunit gamma/tau